MESQPQNTEFKNVPENFYMFFSLNTTLNIKFTLLHVEKPRYLPR